MRIPRIYVETGLRAGINIVLPKTASHHAINVLRLKIGSPLIVFNGLGGEYLGEIVALEKKSVTLLVKNNLERTTESSLKIHLAQAVSRPERMDYAIQKATELGVSEITPVVTKYCTVKVSKDYFQKKAPHWKSTIVNACEQSGRVICPKLNELTNLSQWIMTCSEEIKLVCHQEAEPIVVSSRKNSPTKIAILIGPEGGLSDEEVELAQRFGFQSIRIGPRILRTETAPVAVISILQFLWGDMRF